jgi:hypothetical protein
VPPGTSSSDSFLPVAFAHPTTASGQRLVSLLPCATNSPATSGSAPTANRYGPGGASDTVSVCLVKYETTTVATVSAPIAERTASNSRLVSLSTTACTIPRARSTA